MNELQRRDLYDLARDQLNEADRCRIIGHEWGQWHRQAVVHISPPLLRRDDIDARQPAPLRDIKTVSSRQCLHCKKVETIDD